MKTYLTYGFVIALGSLLLTVVMFFLGFHSDVARIGMAGKIGMVGSLAISITGIVLGTKARRAEVPANEAFGYGRALGAGVMIMLFAALFTIVTTLIYASVINPGMTEITLQAQVVAWEEAGMSASQIETAEAMTRKFMHPAIQSAFAFIGTFIFGTLISLITAAFLKRPASATLPPIVA